MLSSGPASFCPPTTTTTNAASLACSQECGEGSLLSEPWCERTWLAHRQVASTVRKPAAQLTWTPTCSGTVFCWEGRAGQGQDLASQEGLFPGSQGWRPQLPCPGCRGDAGAGGSALRLRPSLPEFCPIEAATESSAWQCGGRSPINGNIGLAPRPTQDGLCIRYVISAVMTSSEGGRQ